jgi:hypothetical protein
VGFTQKQKQNKNRLGGQHFFFDKVDFTQKQKHNKKFVEEDNIFFF